MEKELIPISVENDTPTVSGRALHEALEVKARYNDWISRMCEYGFSDGQDFYSILGKSSGGRPSTDHQLTIDMAKQLCMIQRTDIGRKFRQYFIQVENDWNTPEKVMARALRYAEAELEKVKGVNVALETENLALTEQVEEAKPKVLFADSVSASDNTILIGDLAKLLKQNGMDIGQNRLFELLRQEGFLVKTGSRRNMPTQRAMEAGLFRVKERTVNNPDGTIRTTMTTKVTGKGQQFFVTRYLKLNERKD